MIALGHWRRWAVLLTLHDFTGPVSTHVVANRVKSKGWDVWPYGADRTAACRRTLVVLEHHKQVEREVYGTSGEISWSLTDVGRDLVETHLLNNPNITPAKFREARGGDDA